MKNKKIILLLSGGIDSTTLLAKLASEKYSIIALSFFYGQKHNIEIEYAKNNALKYKVSKHLIYNIPAELFNNSALVSNNIDISTYDSLEKIPSKVNSYVPFRNLIFNSLALSLAETMEVNKVFIAVNKDDAENYWDCKDDFIKKINSIASINSNIKILTPFINYTKQEVIAVAKELNVDLKNTISCYQPINNLECGKCLSCIVKKNALILN